MAAYGELPKIQGRVASPAGGTGERVAREPLTGRVILRLLTPEAERTGR